MTSLDAYLNVYAEPSLASAIWRFIIYLIVLISIQFKTSLLISAISISYRFPVEKIPGDFKNAFCYSLSDVGVPEDPERMQTVQLT